MELINRIRKSRKGFTLVEIIVVLVILAILAAFTIPSMLGFVDDAKGKAMIAEAREVYVATQAAATENLAKATSTDTISNNSLGSKLVQAAVVPTATSTVAQRASYQVQTYLNDDLEISSADAASKDDGTSWWTVKLATETTGTGSSAVTSFTGKIEEIVYSKNGYTVTIIEPATGSASSASVTVTKY